MRPTIKDVQVKLNEIHPLKGELIENLIEMVCLQTTFYLIQQISIMLTT